MKLPRASIAVLALSLVLAAPAQTKRTVTPDDYKQWENLAAPAISADGKWISYQLARVDADGSLVIKASDGPIAATVPDAARAQFSDDSKWIGYLIGPTRAVAERLRAERKPIETKFALRNLADGKEMIFDAVQGFDFLKGGRFLIARRFRGATKSEGGGDLIVIDLRDGSQLTIGNVVAVSPNHAETLLALRTESDSGEKGLEVLNPETRSLTPVCWGKGAVPIVDWAKNTDALAFLQAVPDEEHEAPNHRVFLATDVAGGKPKLKLFPADKLPKETRVAETAPLMISDDGQTVAFGFQTWRLKSKDTTKPEDKANVEVWNTHDLRVVPDQKVNLQADRNKTTLGVWHIDDGSFRAIGDGKRQSVRLTADFTHAILSDPTPYESAVTNGIEYRDQWIVDTKTGEQIKVVAKTQWPVSPSRTGKYLAYYDRRAWWIYDVAKAVRKNLTEDIKVPFENLEDDHFAPELPPVGDVEWLRNDDGLLIADEFDTWLIRTGTYSATALTNGRKEHEQYRFVDPDPNDAEDGPSIQKPLTFRFRDKDTKSTGYYTTDALGKGKKLIELEAQMDLFLKSKDTDRVLFQMESFEKSPNLFLTNVPFTAIKPESKTNPQQANFFWGKSELVTYKSRFGKALQGVLIYPADYVKGRTYPMVTYVYERLSDSLYSYSAPMDINPYNAQILSQNGYFVFLPDITYQPRNPGKAAVDCLEPALNAVFAKNVGVDATKVGLIGHSWGAYETAFVTTVSKAFAVGVAGAPLTELTSMYNSFYWNTGVSQQVLIENGQGRMQVPFWEDPKAYIENSPVWQSAKRTAPILIEAGDADGAVPWQQAQYLFQTLRRMGKNAVLIVYPGENHGLARRPNMLDYAHRLRHFLDVYLKGAKPEPWVTDGVPYINSGH